MSHGCRSIIVNTDAARTKEAGDRYHYEMEVKARGLQIYTIIGIIEVPCSPQVQIIPPLIFSDNTLLYSIDTGIHTYLVNDYTTDDKNCLVNEL